MCRPVIGSHWLAGRKEKVAPVDRTHHKRRGIGNGMSKKKGSLFSDKAEMLWPRRLLEPRSDDRWMVRSLERCSMQERGSLEYASLWCTVKPLEILAIPCALGWEFRQQDQHESSQSFSDLVDIFLGTEAVGFLISTQIPQKNIPLQNDKKWWG